MKKTLLALALLVGCAVPAVHAAPGDALGWLPDETVVAFRIDFKNLWRGPLMGDSRRLIQKGGAAYALLQMQMSPRLDEVEEITGGAWLGPDGAPRFLIALTASSPIDVQKAASTYLGLVARPVSSAAGRVWESQGISLAQVSDREILIGSGTEVKAAIGRKKGKPRFEGLLDGQIAIQVARNPAIEALGAAVPELFAPLAASKSFKITVATQGEKAVLALRLAFDDEKQATMAQEAVGEARKMAKEVFDQGRAQIKRQMSGAGENDLAYHFGIIMGLGWHNLMEKEINRIQIRKNGAELSSTLEANIADLNSAGIGPMQAGMAIGLLLPAMQGAREGATRAESTNNMKILGLAMFNYEATYGHFPPAVITDKNGKPLYSWRVLLLPYIEQDAVYRAWKLDEPWDGPNNKRLSDLVIKTFCEPTEPPSNRTHYRVFHGNGALFNTAVVGKINGSRVAEITDGTSNTLMIAQTRDSVPWAAPDEIAYDQTKPLPALGLPGANDFLCGIADGSVRRIKTNLKPQTLHWLIQKADGNALPDLDK